MTKSSSLFLSWVLLALVCGSAQHSFPVPTTVVHLHQTRVIPLLLADSPEPAQLLATSSDPDVVEIVAQPAVVDGKMAYIRIRGIRLGQASLQVDGAAVQISVVESHQRHFLRPRIVTPVDGAVVWGKFTVGVDVVDSPVVERVVLRLADGKQLSATGESVEGGVARLNFVMDSAMLANGCTSLIAVAISGGREFVSRAIEVFAFTPDSLVSGECEDSTHQGKSQRFGENPLVGSHPQATGEKFVANYAAKPAWSLAYEAKRAGMYQMRLTARGDFAGGAFPTVQLYVDDSPEAVTATRLVSRYWHRIALGTPFYLEAGHHTLTAYFANDFFVPQGEDRNLFLDNYELAYVDDHSNSGESSALMRESMVAMREKMMAMREKNDGELRIAFARLFDGQVFSGKFTVAGKCWSASNTIPEVKLLVNGHTISRQWAVNPIFLVHRPHLHEGLNTIRLEAIIPSGIQATTVEQTLFVKEGDDNSSAHGSHRFTIHDPRWGKSLRQSSEAIQFDSATKLSLHLPAQLSGKYQIFATIRGQATLHISSLSGEQSETVAKISGKKHWQTMTGGIVELGEKPEEFIFSLGGQNESSLQIRDFYLLRAPDTIDRQAPRVTLLYPSAGQQVFAADAVVFQTYDNEQIIFGDLLIDGKPLLMQSYPIHDNGTMVLPLPLRSLPPGEHTLAVRVQDSAGNVGESSEIRFLVSAQSPAEGTQYARAVALLNRFAYGVEPEELAAILTMGEQNWLQQRLEDGRSNRDLANIEQALAMFPRGDSISHVKNRAIQQLIHTDNPVRARFVMWAQNHFSTYIRKAGGAAKWREHMQFWQRGIAPFDDLLRISATSPAMLYYLDQQRNSAFSINENYAREIMELHTLGVDGGYSQGDVTHLASLLTGWTIAEEADISGNGSLSREFRFVAALNDFREKIFLGSKLETVTTEQDSLERIRLSLEILAAHPNTARFICRKLAYHYVGKEISPEFVEQLAQVYMATAGDCKQVLRAIANHREFWQHSLRSDKFANPLDFMIHLNRCLQINAGGTVNKYLDSSGMGLFERISPDGYPEGGENYTNSNVLTQRWRFVEDMRHDLFRLIPPGWQRKPQMKNPRWQQKVIDVVALQLTGKLLGDSSNEAALRMFAPIAPMRQNNRKKLMRLVTFIAQLPEANLR